MCTQVKQELKDKVSKKKCLVTAKKCLRLQYI